MTFDSFASNSQVAACAGRLASNANGSATRLRRRTRSSEANMFINTPQQSINVGRPSMSDSNRSQTTHLRVAADRLDAMVHPLGEARAQSVLSACHCR